MPRLAHTVDPARLLTEHERVLLHVLVQEINALRQAAGLPLRTPQQVKARVREALTAERRGGVS